MLTSLDISKKQLKTKSLGAMEGRPMGNPTEQYDTGMGTTPGMWQMLSDSLDGVKLPESINNAIYALSEGRAVVADNGEAASG